MLVPPPTARPAVPMPIHFTVDPDLRLVSYLVSRPPTKDEAHAFLDRVTGHFYFQRGFALLGECAGVCRPDAAFGHALAHAACLRAHLLGSCRWAVVAEPSSGWGMVRMWASLLRGTRVQVAPFASVREAAAWTTGDQRPAVRQPPTPGRNLVPLLGRPPGAGEGVVFAHATPDVRSHTPALGGF